MTTKDKLNALAERVEALKGPCRETDGEIERTLPCSSEFARHHPGKPLSQWNENAFRFYSLGDEGREYLSPAFTASLDAAMTLVPEGKILRSYRVSRFVPHTCEVAVDYAHGGWIGNSDHSFALALTAAAIRARASEVE